MNKSPDGVGATKKRFCHGSTAVGLCGCDAARGLEGSMRLAFEEPPSTGAEMVGRSHPLPATLAETLVEGAFECGKSAKILATLGFIRGIPV